MKRYTAKKTLREIENIGLYSYSELQGLLCETGVPAILRDLAKSIIEGDYDRAAAIKQTSRNGLLIQQERPVG